MSVEKIVIHADPDIEDLIPGYIENRHKDIERMKTALVNNDYETIRELGHSMKGSGGGYGFDAITGIGASLELAAKEADLEDIEKRIEELSSYLERVEVVYG